MSSNANTVFIRVALAVGGTLIGLAAGASLSMAFHGGVPRECINTTCTFGLAGQDVTGGNSSENVFTDGGNDMIFHRDGADNGHGEGDNDYLDGGEGFDNLDGEAGNENWQFGNECCFGLWGDTGADTVDGEAGQDIVAGGQGQDDVFGGPDNDSLAGNSDADFLDGGAGFDRCEGGNDPGDRKINCETN